MQRTDPLPHGQDIDLRQATELGSAAESGGEGAGAPRRRGRPRKNADHAELATFQPVSKRLLQQLLEQPDWLREPESEGQIAARLAVPKSSAREAIQMFVQQDALEREAAGIRRHKVQIGRLVSLYGLRLAFETTAFRRLMDSRFDKNREQLAIDLFDTIMQQEQCKDDFIRWLEKGIEFHCEILNKAGLEAWAPILNTALLQVRIASYMKEDTPEQRDLAIAEHRALVEAIRTCDRSLVDVVERHVRNSLIKVIEARHARHIRYSTENKSGGSESPQIDVDKLWTEVREIAHMSASMPAGA